MDASEFKGAKKAVKAQAKLEKKRLKQETKLTVRTQESHSAQPPESAAAESPTHVAKPTAAERSAAAAEKQLKLQTWRVVLALLTLAVALFTFLFTQKPWKAWQSSARPSETSTETETRGQE